MPSVLPLSISSKPLNLLSPLRSKVSLPNASETPSPHPQKGETTKAGATKKAENEKTNTLGVRPVQAALQSPFVAWECTKITEADLLHLATKGFLYD